MSSRQEGLDLVTQAIMTDRNRDYAPPEQNFERIAKLWRVYLDGRSTDTITPYDTAIMVGLVKVARAIESPNVVDHMVDLAGYALCALDVLPPAPETEQPEPEPVPEMSESERVDAEGVPATYEGAPGLYVSDGAGGVFYGGGGRKVAVTSYGAAVKAGVLVLS